MTEPDRLTVYITQRARGIYLVHGMEDTHGTEEWDALSTLSAAKRWGWNYVGRRVRYEEIRKPGHWPQWRIEADV
jgi:hypothetical protein